MDINTKHLIIAVANDCFVSCTGCYNFWAKDKKIISNDDIINFLNQIDSDKIQKLTISGGDPLVRSDIVQLLTRIKKLNYRVNLDTVGTAFMNDTLSNKNKEYITYKNPKDFEGLVDTLGIPLDGADEQTIKTFRTGRENLFSEQVRILQVLDNINIKVCVNTVVHRQNVYKLQDIYEIIKGFQKVKQWQLFQYMPIGVLGYKNRATFSITDDVFVEETNNLKKHVECNDCLNIVTKTKTQRKNLYLLLDTAGYAWVPKTSIE